MDYRHGKGTDVKKGEMLKPENTDNARQLVVKLTELGASERNREAVYLAFNHGGQSRYVWLDKPGLREIRKRVSALDLVGALIPLRLRRVRNPRTGQMVDRYYVDTDPSGWEQLQDRWEAGP